MLCSATSSVRRSSTTLSLSRRRRRSHALEIPDLRWCADRGGNVDSASAIGVVAGDPRDAARHGGGRRERRRVRNDRHVAVSISYAAGLNSEQVGLVLGLGVHDTSQVMGAAMTYKEVFQDETALKGTRRAVASLFRALPPRAHRSLIPRLFRSGRGDEGRATCSSPSSFPRWRP